LVTPDKPVFYDPAGRRWRRVRRTYLALAVVVTAVAAIFIASVLAKPLLPSFNIRPAPTLKPKPPVLPNPSDQAARRAQDKLRRELQKQKRVPAAKKPQEMAIAPPPAIPPPIIPSRDGPGYAAMRRSLIHPN